MGGNNQFDPNSHDATFARILANQEEAARQARISAENLEIQIREHRAETQHCFEAIGHRVGRLESFRDTLKGKLAVVAAVGGSLAAGVVEFFSRKHD